MATQKKPAAKPAAVKTQKSKEELRKEYKLKMERQRKFKRLLAIVVLALVAVVAGVVLSLTVFFKISTVEVTGLTQYTSDEVVTVCGIEQGDNLFLVDKDKVVEHVSEALPFTGEITVKRSFPNKIVINVTDSDVACAVKYEKGYVLINNEEKVLATAKSIKGVNTILKEQYDKKAAAEEAAAAKTSETTTETTEAADTTAVEGETTTAEGESTTAEEETTAAEGEDSTAAEEEKTTIKISSTKIDSSVLLLTGLTVEEAVPGYELVVSNASIFDSYRELMDKLQEYGITDITAIDLSSPSAITVTYQDRIIMSIGSVSGLDKKLQMAVKVLEEQNQVSDELVGTIDLSISGRAYFSEGTTRTTLASTEVTTETADASAEDGEDADEEGTTGTGSSATTVAASSTVTTEAATGSINTTNAVE